jgi:hypothetical protein
LLLALTSRREGVAWLLEVAGAGINGLSSKRPSGVDFDIGSLLFSSSRQDFRVVTGGTPFQIGNDLGDFDLHGTWNGLTAGGRDKTYEFSSVSSKQFQVRSSGLIGPAAFLIDEDCESHDNGRRVRLLRGRVFGTFANDPNRKQRMAPLRMTVWDSGHVDAETQYIEWDSRGREMRRVFRPFRMSKMS